jgi:hypothetical protein
MAELTRKQYNALDSLEWGEKVFGALMTNRQVPRRVVVRLVALGLARSVGTCTVCDDDGFLKMPEREREGFVLTEQGRKVLEDWEMERYEKAARPA